MTLAVRDAPAELVTVGRGSTNAKGAFPGRSLPLAFSTGLVNEAQAAEERLAAEAAAKVEE